MKNLTPLVSREDVHAYVSALWKSDIFRDSYNSKGFIYKQVDRFAWLPRLFAEMTNDYLERPHFSTWWNIIMLREYDNPIIHDLYLLHEIVHAATMPYLPGIGREAFSEKMQRNELEASVVSEIQVYFELPGLREVSFDHYIYADDFLNDFRMEHLWTANREVAIETMRTMRRHVMVSKPEHTLSPTEKWIRRFAEQNAVYMLAWTDSYQTVEALMAALQTEASHHRGLAISEYARRLLHHYTDDIPFKKEAELFAPFYWNNKEKYDREKNIDKKVVQYNK